MTHFAHPPRRGLRRGIAATALLWILALALLPGHGHDVAWADVDADPVSFPEHSGADHDVDCFLCHVAGSAALPSVASAPTEPPSEAEASVAEPDRVASTPLATPGNARAPPIA
jgi:hypothetical protein